MYKFLSPCPGPCDSFPDVLGTWDGPFPSQDLLWLFREHFLSCPLLSLPGSCFPLSESGVCFQSFFMVCKVSLDKYANLLMGVLLGDRIFFFSLDLEFSLCLCFWMVYSVRLGEGCFVLKFWGYLSASWTYMSRFPPGLGNSQSFFLSLLGLLAACGLSLAAVSRGCSSLQCIDFSLWWRLLVQSTGSRCTGFGSCGTLA